MALAEAVEAIMCLKNVLNDLGVEQGAWKIFHENDGCLKLATCGAARFFNKRKHIDIKHNFVMLMLESDIIRLVPVRTTVMKADFLTKRLSPTGLKGVITALRIFSHPTTNY